MKKNVILLVSFIYIPVTVYGSSNVSKNSLINNDDKVQLVENMGVGDTLDNIGDFMEDVGGIVEEVGDDGKETDNVIETAGKHLSILGKICKLFGDFCKKVD